MPGVADQIRRTNLKNEQKERKKDMEELVQLVKENRIHEADERQLEILKLSLELNKILEKQPPQPQAEVSPDDITTAVQKGIAEALKNIPNIIPNTASELSTERPAMKHTSLTEITQAGSGLQISGDLETETKSSDDGSSKLDKLKKLKGNGR